MSGEARDGLLAFLATALVRFWLGTAGAVAAGYVAFRGALFEPGHPAFETLAVGMLVAGILTLVRLSLRGQALALLLAYGALQYAVADGARWAAALAGALLGFGILVVGEVYHELALRRVRIGKFLMVGPLVGGAMMAVAPIGSYRELIPFDTVRPLLLQLFMGIVIGDGVGLGLELAELIPLGGASVAGATTAERAS